MKKIRICENPEHEIAYSYAEILNVVSFCAIYSVILPIGLAFAIVSLICIYWGEKVYFIN